MQFTPAGVVPAALMPWTPDMAMDLPGLRRHLSDLAGVRGVTAVCVNGHASEVVACTEDEQAAILATAVDEIGSRLPVVGGVCSESSLVAASHARRWTALGASALLVVPPSTFAKGAQLRPEMVVEHYSRIAAATDLPLIVFQYSAASGQAHSLETLLRLAETIPTVRAIKDYCGDPVLHEQTVRHLQNGPRRVNVLTAHSSWLLPSLALGCAGILSGAGSTIAPLQVELFEAMQAGDLSRAREVAERIDVPNRLFYRPPLADQHNRMKEAQVLMGRFAHAAVRPPLMKLPAAEIAALRAGLLRAGLIAEER
jgi:4-hydroxy-tetrahydrodipicolinate synthase